MTMIPIVVESIGTVIKKLKKRLDKLDVRGRINSIQTTALMKSVTMFRRVLDIRVVKLPTVKANV